MSDGHGEEKNILRYSQLLMFLLVLHDAGLLSEEEAVAIKARIMKSYGILSDWTA